MANRRTQSGYQLWLGRPPTAHAARTLERHARVRSALEIRPRNLAGRDQVAFYRYWGHRFSMATFPQFSWNWRPSSVSRGLAAPGSQFFLPFEAATTVGDFTVTAELGRNFVHRRTESVDRRHRCGPLVRRQIGMCRRTTPTCVPHNPQTLANVGLHWQLSHFCLCWLAPAANSARRPRTKAASTSTWDCRSCADVREMSRRAVRPLPAPTARHYSSARRNSKRYFPNRRTSNEPDVWRKTIRAVRLRPGAWRNRPRAAGRNSAHSRVGCSRAADQQATDRRGGRGGAPARARPAAA